MLQKNMLFVVSEERKKKKKSMKTIFYIHLLTHTI